MEAISSSETVVSTYQITPRNIPQDPLLPYSSSWAPGISPACFMPLPSQLVASSVLLYAMLSVTSGGWLIATLRPRLLYLNPHIPRWRTTETSSWLKGDRWRVCLFLIADHANSLSYRFARSKLINWWNSVAFYEDAAEIGLGLPLQTSLHITQLSESQSLVKYLAVRFSLCCDFIASRHVFTSKTLLILDLTFFITLNSCFEILN
jgi:hypothetical protein